MSQFLKVNALGYHIDGGYIGQTVDRYEVRISSTYSDSREPDYKRKLLQLILSQTELDDLIAGLVAIKHSKRRADVPVEV